MQMISSEQHRALLSFRNATALDDEAALQMLVRYHWNEQEARDHYYNDPLPIEPAKQGTITLVCNAAKPVFRYMARNPAKMALLCIMIGCMIWGPLAMLTALARMIAWGFWYLPAVLQNTIRLLVVDVVSAVLKGFEVKQWGCEPCEGRCVWVPN